MPFLLLDDATDEATRRLQDFGQQQLQNLSQLNQPPFPGALGTTPGAPPPVPGVSLPQPPQQLQQFNQPPLQDITARLQDFGQSQLQNAVKTIQPLNQPQQPSVQDVTSRLQDFGQNQIQDLTQKAQTFTNQFGGGDQVQPGGDLEAYARQAAQKAGVDPDLFVRQIQQESGFNPGARSPAGAIGIAQFMPDTARGMNVDPTDPYAALDAAAQMDAQNLRKYGGDYAKMLAAYNAGPGPVDQYNGVPPYQETQNYVQKILGGAGQAVQQGVSAVKQAVTGQPDTSADVFPVVGYQGQIADHWGSVKGGSDIMAPRGTPVVAMRGGKVLESGWNDVGGNSVLVQGDDGNQYYYAHFDGAPSVKVGDTITAGTPLGAVGNTGDASGGPTHLHIGIGPSILLGADKYGGTGGDFDAVGLLRSTLQGGQQQAPNTAAGPATLAPPTPQAIAGAVQGGLQQLQDITAYAGTPQGSREFVAHLPSAFISDRLREGLDTASSAYQDWAARNRAAVAGTPVLGGLADLTQNLADTSTPMGAALATLPIGGLEMEGPAAAGMTRMFHGTGADFPKVDPAAISGEGNLYGPGYYLTSDPRVAGGVFRQNLDDLHAADLYDAIGRPDQAALLRANAGSLTGGYAQARATGEVGPNVRAVDVPRDLNLLDVAAPADQNLVQRLLDWLDPRDARSLQNRLGSWSTGHWEPSAGLTNEHVYRALSDIEGPIYANKDLAEAGFDGITHEGGVRMPMPDASGQDIRHTVNVIFPESLDKIRNAVSGRMGGEIRPEYATGLAGATAAGTAAYLAATDPNSNRMAETGANLAGAGFAAPVTSAIGGAFDQAGRNLSGNLGLRPRTADEQAQIDAMNARAQGSYEPIGLMSLLPGAGAPSMIGAEPSTLGPQLEDAINRWVAEHNPARDIPVAGPVSTFAEQQFLNPTNLMLMYGGGLVPGRAALELLRDPAIARLVTDEAGNINYGRLADLLGQGVRQLRGGIERPFNYDKDTPEGRFEELAAASRAAAADGLAHIDLNTLPKDILPFGPQTVGTRLMGTNAGKLPTLDDLRLLRDVSLNQRDFYGDSANEAAGIVGPNNIDEWQALNSITSSQTPLANQVAEAIRTMGTVRQAANDAAANGQDVRQAVLDAINSKEQLPLMSYTHPQKRAFMAQGYDTGVSEVKGAPKTSSFQGNYDSALRGVFDPRITNDTWDWQIMNLDDTLTPGVGPAKIAELTAAADEKASKILADATAKHQADLAAAQAIDDPKVQAKAVTAADRAMQVASNKANRVSPGIPMVRKAFNLAANDDTAYRGVEAVFNELGAELGIDGYQAQSAMWSGIRHLFSDPQLEAMWKAGQFRQAIQEGLQRGVFQQDLGGEIGSVMDHPTVQAELQKWGDVIKTPPPLNGQGMQRAYYGLSPTKPAARPPRPATAAFRLEQGAQREAGAPLVQGITQDTVDQLGLTPDGRLPWLSTGHRVVEAAPGQYVVHLPSGNSDTAQYVAARLGQISGDPETHIHIPDTTASLAIGQRGVGTPEDIQSLASALNDANIPNVVGASGRSIQIPWPKAEDEATAEAILQVASRSGFDLNNLSPYQGVLHAVPESSYAGLTEALGPQFGPTTPGRSDLLRRLLGGGTGPGAESVPSGADLGAQAQQAVRDFLSGAGSEAGAVSPQLGLRLGGAGLGALGGAATAPEDATPQERLARAGVGAAAGLVAPSLITRPGRTIQQLRIGSLAGGISTLTHIAANIPVQGGLKLASDVPLSLATLRPGTTAAELYGALQGLRSWGVSAAGALGRAGVPTGDQALDAAMTGLVGLHQPMQNIVGDMASHMDLWKSAADQATATLGRMAQFTAPWRAEVARLIANPTPNMLASADAAAQRASLNTPLGTTGKWISEGVKASPFVRFMLPIWQKGYAIASQGVELTPLGWAGMGADVARGLAGQGPYAGGNWAGRGAAGAVTPLAERFRNALIGLALMYEGYNQASQGNVTGEGPSDPKEQADLRQTGWQPDSSRIGGRYVDNHLLGPVGWALSAGANAYEATHGPQVAGQPMQQTGLDWITNTQPQAGGYATPKATPQGEQAPTLTDMLGDIVAREGRYFNNETFLSSLGNALNLIGSTKQQGQLPARELATTLESLIPQGALLANVASSQDPYQRATRATDPLQQIQQAIQSRIPGQREQLQPRLSATGQPLVNPQQGLGLLVPRSSVIQNDPILREAARLGVTPVAAPKTMPYGSAYDVQLTSAEQQRWEQLRGQALQDAAGKLMASKVYQDLPKRPQGDIAQRNALAKVVSSAATTADGELLQELTQGKAAQAAIQSRLIPKGALAPVYSYAPNWLTDASGRPVGVGVGP